jgi:antitoxin (DNA-binding transcriptional repressor) of toxin-antitoxin stability system
MAFVTTRELVTELKQTRERLSEEGDLTLTLNGKPIAVMVSVQEDDYEETLRAIRQAKALQLIQGMRLEARERGYLSTAEIEDEIRAARKSLGHDAGRDAEESSGSEPGGSSGPKHRKR